MPVDRQEFRSRVATLAVPIGFVLLALLLQLPLLLNPGYYSHDELQWAARADVAPGQSLPWVSWWDWRVFQFRPLTFNTWLLLSQALFRSPVAFHGLWVALGVGNGLLLLRLLRRLQVATVPALLFSLGFLLGPFAVYTHGWVATLADLLWVGFALILANTLAWAGHDPARRAPACVAALVLTALALLAKESAIVMPPLIALTWLLAGRPRTLRDAAIASALPVLVYLALRMQVILYAPRAAHAYHWSLVWIPKQWFMYQVFPWAPSVSEIVTVLAISSKHLLAAGVLWLSLTVLAWRANFRAGVLLTIGGALALGPVLLLEIASDQYGYGFAALTMVALAMAWADLRRAGRILAVLFVLVGVWHGANLQLQFRHVGQLQARFSPALAQAVATARQLPVRLRAPADDAWVYERLTHEIPSYLGVPIGDRVRLVGENDAADYLIAPDGSLLPP